MLTLDSNLLLHGCLARSATVVNLTYSCSLTLTNLKHEREKEVIPSGLAP